jgi:O-acetylhomoserine (thiol)-lyase
MNIDTLCLHSGYKAANGEPHVLPIFQSTTYDYDSTEHVGKLFDLSVPGHMYSRISNPTVGYVEQRIAAMEGGVAAICTTSGQTASFISLTNILSAGDHIVACAQIYGGTTNLLSVTMKRFGIELTFVDCNASDEEISAAFKENTRAMFGETISNPSIDLLDIEKFARIAHAHGVPLIVDNTFATPSLCRPIEHGADIVIHSTTKYMDGHATVVGGVVVDSGNFDWKASGKYPGLTEPDESYHGLIYTEAFGKAAYTTKLRVQMVRDLGVYPSAMDAFVLNMGLDTLPLRMERHSANAAKVAKYMEECGRFLSVKHPSLESHPQYALAQKYLTGGSGVISAVLDGGRDGAARFLDNLKLATQDVHVADIRTMVLHPATSTHRQLSEEMLVAAGITPGLIRFSCGCEAAEDIIADIEQSLSAI